MSTTCFSLTEQLFVNSILSLQAPPLNTPDTPLTIPEKIGYFFQSEVTTRIIAVALSFFAAIDSMAHFGIGLLKIAQLGLRRLGISCFNPAPTCKEIAHHFKQSTKYFGITLIGSIASTVWPGIVKHFKASPYTSLIDTTEDDWRNTSDKVQSLWNKTTNKNEFERLWETTSIHDKRTFVQLLNGDNSSKGVKAKSELVDTIYKTITRPSNQWPKQQDTSVFYHATSKKGLEGILKTRKVEVRHEKAFRGAFVSTQPETRFGKYVLVFNRNIERLSHLNHGFSNGDAYWAGFSCNIPVNATTLHSILVVNSNHNEISEITDTCNTLTGRKIKVKNYFSDHAISRNKDIPKEWPLDDKKSGIILKTMLIRKKQKQLIQQQYRQCLN